MVWKMITDAVAASDPSAVLSASGSLLGSFGHGSDFVSATVKSLVVILVTEIGDKTFFIAAVSLLITFILYFIL